MYAVSFRIKVAEVPGHQIFYLNGSTNSTKKYKKGEVIEVSERNGPYFAEAEVIETNGTTRDPETFRWEIYEKA